MDATVTSETAADSVIETGFPVYIVNDLALFDTDANDADHFITPGSSSPDAVPTAAAGRLTPSRLLLPFLSVQAG